MRTQDLPGSRQPYIVFWTLPADVEDLAAALREHASVKVDAVPTAGASGGGDLVPVIVALAAPTLTFLAGVITAWLGRSASIEVDGVKATGLSPKAVEDLLRRRLAAREKPVDSGR